MPRPTPAFMLLLAILLSGGCTAMSASPGKTSDTSIESPALVRNHGYALLYSTVKDEADLDKVLIFKDPSRQVANLLKAISHLNHDAQEHLDAFAKQDPSLDLKQDGLPAIELKSRASISSATTRQVLSTTGKDFEFTILMTQHQALDYITHTALVLAAGEKSPPRKEFLANLAKESGTLHERVIALLEAPYVGKAK